MADTARAAKAAPLRRDAILEAVAYSAERLLLEPDWRRAAGEVVARLGVAASTSRAAVIENIADADGPGATWVASWSANGTPDPWSEAPIRWADDGLGRWADRLGRGELILGLAQGFPADERRILDERDVVSTMWFPVFVDGIWWGAIGLEDCTAPREWMSVEQDALRALASMLGAAIKRQRSDDERRAVERRYRNFVEQIPAVTYTDVPDGDVVRMGFVSPQIATILGYPHSAFLEDPKLWGSLIHPDDYGKLIAQDAFNPEDLRPFDEEYRMRTADGRWVWVHDTSTTILGEDGEIEYFQGFMIDATERRAAEEQLRRAEERFRVLVEGMPAVTYTEQVAPGTCRATVMDYISPQAERLLGYPTQAWNDDVDFWATICHPDDVERVNEATELANIEGMPYSVDYRVFAADGRVVWLQEEAVLVRDESGTPLYWQGFMLDITDRKQAEEQVGLAEARFRTIVENTPAITYQELPTGAKYDATATITYVSPQIESILGYDAAEWSSIPGYWTNAMHPDDLARVVDEGQRTSRSGEPYRQEYRMIAADGRTVWFHDESHLIRDADGQPVLWQGVMLDITERKEAEERLATAQARLEALIEHIPAVVYIESPDADPAKFYLSPQVEQIFGYTAQEWTWTPDFWLDHIHPDDREAVLQADVQTDVSHDAYAMEYRFRDTDGRYVWIHDEAVYVPDEHGNGFWQGFLFDITARKEAEEGVARAERLHRATVEHLPAVVYREAPVADAAKLYISPQVEQVFGYTADQWRSSRQFWADHLHPDDRERVLAANNRANASKEPFALDYRFRRADGAYIWIHDEATFVSPEPGHDGWWQGFLLDITARQEAEDQLREAEKKFRTIVEQSPAVIYTQSMDHIDASASRTTYISPQVEQVFGFTAEETLADPLLWTRLIHPEDRERVLNADHSSNTDGEGSFSLEYRMLAQDGRVVWVQDQAVLVQVGEREPFWQGFLLDVTERKQAEERLEHALAVEREATARLRTLDEMKNTFLQAVSHDLRTPLAAILGLAITLERGDVHLEEEDARDLARRIADNARRLDRLVTNLLDLDRLARGIVAPKLQPIDVGSLIRRVLSESELISDERLVTDIQPVVAPVDASKVERIIENLLANTARHTPPTARVWVSVRAAPEGVMILVEDEGPGIDADLREAIFEPFRQGPDAPRHAPGVGVGLTLVRRFAELHGGRAWVEQREGGGASFRVLLPATLPEGGSPAI